MKVWHSTGFETPHLLDQPIWFATKLETSIDVWSTNIRIHSGESFVYEAEIEFEFDNDDLVYHLLGKNNADTYFNQLVANASSKDIIDLESTKILTKYGVNALHVQDYDPVNFDKNEDSIIVLKPLYIIKSWNLIEHKKGKQ